MHYAVWVVFQGNITPGCILLVTPTVNQTMSTAVFLYMEWETEWLAQLRDASFIQSSGVLLLSCLVLWRNHLTVVV